LKPLGIQLYTVRRQLPQNPLGILRELEAIGYREAELVSDHLDLIWPALAQTSIRPVGLHLPADLFTTNPAGLPAALENARKRGLQYVICPWVAPRDRGTDGTRRQADTLNRTGDACQRLGLRLCYHNHAFDFAPEGQGRRLDILMRSTDPKLVGIELDIMWAHVAGVEPVQVLKQYGGRVELMHLKNVSADVKPRYDENIPAGAFREVGNGVIDIAPVLAAAAHAGVKHYFVEQDETGGDPVASVRQSYGYLEKLEF
jgi:sugar phosphate isomerase/epimerase